MRWFVQGLPAVYLSQRDLSAREKRPEQHAGSVGTGQDALSFDASLELLVQAFDGIGGADRFPLRRRIAQIGEQVFSGFFERAGFAPYDVHMSDLQAGRVRLADFKGLAACGGFSYGDVLGAGQGWAKSVLFNDRLQSAIAEAGPCGWAVQYQGHHFAKVVARAILPELQDDPGDFARSRCR